MIEQELPSPEELMPLSQSLITPRLALAFDIPSPGHRPRQQQPPPPYSQPIPADLGDLVSGASGEEPPRTLKRPRLVWTPQLHKRFVDAVAHLGINNAVPKTIMQLMSVDGLTRENVASHLQKYRLYLKRMQGLSGGGGGGGATADPTTDHLFASSPVPPHFLHPAPGLQHHHHQQRIAAAVGHPQLVAQYHRQMGQFGSSPNGQFEHSYLGKQPPIHNNRAPSSNGNGGVKALTLFPTRE